MGDASSSAPPKVFACVLACSGCSAAGELADHTARHLQRSGSVRMSCLAGVGGRVPSIMATVQGASMLLMIDGCPLECGANVLRRAGFSNFRQLKLHEHGVRKGDSGALDHRTVERLAAEAVHLLGEPGDQAAI